VVSTVLFRPLLVTSSSAEKDFSGALSSTRVRGYLQRDTDPRSGVMGRGFCLRLFCSEQAKWRTRIDDALAAHGIPSLAESADDGERPATTLVLFDQLSPAVLSVVKEVSRGGRDRTIAIASHDLALGERETWQLLGAGVADTIAWTNHGDPAAHVAARIDRWSRIDALLETPAVARELVGTSPRWIACLRQLVETAVFSDSPVLLLGESGTGKELLARLVHTLDARPGRGEQVTLDCTTVVPDLSGSEFFGHERGAYTGAVGPREGAFALADRGTLFLDEVGELPLTLQAQLLRAVQERTYKRVGSNVWQHTNFRLVCATHRDLRQDVAAGRFRADFFHRIASRICYLPSLNERREDILPLTHHFLQALRPNDPPPSIDRAVSSFLVDRDYPGNVRELKQLVGRIGDRHVGPGPITAGDIPEDERPKFDPDENLGRPSRSEATFDDVVMAALQRGVGLREIGRAASDAAIRLAIASEDGNLKRAAKRLGVTDRALQMRRAQNGE
jgi:DNA-binding NtrC family response regulator